MNEIEKEIEEMAKVIESTEFDWYVQEGTSLQDWVKMHAQALYNAGYRNVQDKVVLTEEELRQMVNARTKCVNNMAIRTRKETARDILGKVLEFAERSLKIYGCIEEVDFEVLCNELAEKYGVKAE